MSRTRRTVGVGVLVGLLATLLLASPAAAQTSVNSELITGLNLTLLYVAVPITVIVEGILIYTVWKYKDSDEASPTKENRRLEITWTVATAVILLFVGLASYQVLGSAFIGGATATDAGDQAAVDVPNLGVDVNGQDAPGAKAPTEPNAVQIDVQAQKYFWTFHYPKGQEFTMSETGETVSIDRNITKTSSSGDHLVIPADQPVYLHITSKDWLHAFHVPDLGLKQDAFPGQYNTIKTVTYLEDGQSKASYQLYCAEYCGVGHSQMLGVVDVVDQETFAQWVADNQSDGSGSSE